MANRNDAIARRELDAKSFQETDRLLTETHKTLKLMLYLLANAAHLQEKAKIFQAKDYLNP